MAIGGVRTALGACVAFTVGMAYLLDWAPQPLEAEPSPLVARMSDEAWLGGELSAPVARTDAGQARAMFSVPSIVERAQTAQRGAQPMLAIAPANVRHQDTVASTLPPLVVRPVAYADSSWEESEYVDEIDAAGDPAGWAEDEGTQDTVVAVVEEPPVVDEPPVPAAAIHVVRRGDSLARLARRFWGTSSPQALDVLVAANPKLKGRRHRLLVDEKLIIPAHPDLESALTLARSASNDGRGGSGAHAVNIAAVEASETDGTFWYTIQKSDSLSSIARRVLNNERRWPEIKRLNKLRDANRLMPGMRIKLPPLVAVVTG